MTTTLIIAFVLLATAAVGKAHRASLHPAGQLAAPWLHQGTYFRQATQALRVDKCRGRFAVRWVPYSAMPVGLRKWAAGLWLERYRKARNLIDGCAPYPDWWLQQALCVHRYEGAWNDPNAPYYGGMQMDISFQQAYGPEFYKRWGTADNWPVWAQLLASYRGWQARGWYPWPTTARLCGLI